MASTCPSDPTTPGTGCCVIVAGFLTPDQVETSFDPSHFAIASSLEVARKAYDYRKIMRGVGEDRQPRLLRPFADTAMSGHRCFLYEGVRCQTAPQPVRWPRAVHSSQSPL